MNLENKWDKRIKKVGNSFYVLIPRHIMKGQNLSERQLCKFAIIDTQQENINLQPAQAG